MHMPAGEPTPIQNPQTDKSYRLNVCTKYSIALDTSKCYYVQCTSSSRSGTSVQVTWDPREGNPINPEYDYDASIAVGRETIGCKKEKSTVILHPVLPEGESGTVTIKYLECDCPA